MGVSKSKNVENNLSIVSVVINTPIIEEIGHIHKLQGTIGFSGNITNVYSSLEVKIYDTVLAVEQEILYNLITHSPTTQVSYSFDYGTNSEIDILTPSNPALSSSNQRLRVYLDGNLLYDNLLVVDSCLKYFENINNGGNPTFNENYFDFDDSFNFDFTSYIANGDDTLKMYCIGQSEGITQAFTTTTTDVNKKGSVATLDYNINSTSGELNTYNYKLGSIDDVLLEIEKVGYSENNIFTINNASTTIPDIKIYMDKNFNQIIIPYDTGISFQYKVYCPLWEGLTGLSPILSFSGNIQTSGIINPAPTVEKYIGELGSLGEMTFQVNYFADAAALGFVTPPPVPSGNYTRTGVATITLGDFQLISPTLTFTIVVP